MREHRFRAVRRPDGWYDIQEYHLKCGGYWRNLPAAKPDRASAQAAIDRLAEEREIIYPSY